MPSVACIQRACTVCQGIRGDDDLPSPPTTCRDVVAGTSSPPDSKQDHPANTFRSMQLTAHMLAKENSFLYFAYGSNLLTERIRINNPSAKKIAIAKLDGWRLDFNLYGKSWHGAAATIIQEGGRHVWGVVWELDKSDMPNLDKQEYGYDSLKVEVYGHDGAKFECRSYFVNLPLQADRRPSTIYKNVIIKGAVEHELPEEYVAQLREIEDNGYEGPVAIDISLDTLRNG